MRKILFAGAALGTLVAAAPASAADLGRYPVKGPPPMASFMPFSWTGFYFGVNAGYGTGDDSPVTTTGQAAINVTNVAAGARPASVDLSPDGFIGGAQIGYNYQVGTFVYGLETDIQYTRFIDRRTVTTTATNGTDRLDNRFTQELEYLGTFRARLGIAADRALFYVTGGLAYGKIDNAVSFTGPLPGANEQFAGGISRTQVGYTVGAGLEYAFTNNLSFKAEYLYYDLGDHDQVNVASVFSFPLSEGGSGYNSRFRNDGHILRGGLNWRFGAAPAIIARY
jgi:outer membrane immunogenic protein